MSAAPSRRDLLRMAAAATAGGALAACSGGIPGTSVSPSADAGAPDGSSAAVSAAAWSKLSGQLSSPCSAPVTPGGHQATSGTTRTCLAWPHPGAIARCGSAADVAACVRFAAAAAADTDTDTDLRLRAGDHSYAGASVGPGLVADLSPLAAVTVGAASASGGSARVGAGALLVDVYAALAARGLAVGAGSCPSVGICGLTLGGGVGVLAPSFGLACDQVRSATVVTADGVVREVSAAADADLFWALRGGGAGLAAVVEWTFAARPAPSVTTFTWAWAWSAGAQVTSAWQSWAVSAPREVWSGLRLLAEAGCAGLDATACLARARDGADRRPFTATSSILSHPLPAAGITAAVDAVAAAMGTGGLVEGGMAFDALGGAVGEVAVDATAFGWRTALATVQHTATWTDPGADAGPYEDLVHAQRQALGIWCGGSAYVNYADAALLGSPTVAADCWGPNAARLAQVRVAHDPDGVFSPRA